jgi:hypothetical protein
VRAVGRVQQGTTGRKEIGLRSQRSEESDFISIIIYINIIYI